ncbi:unnamed protein product [Closterium sp. Naga37s-1]|nr:unnamed protein product [Closterium sp. Naga37s-1]
MGFSSPTIAPPHSTRNALPPHQRSFTSPHISLLCRFVPPLSLIPLSSWSPHPPQLPPPHASALYIVRLRSFLLSPPTHISSPLIFLPFPPSPAASPPHASALYIVRLRSAPPVASYRGGIPGFPATAVWDSDPNGCATDATADGATNGSDAAASSNSSTAGWERNPNGNAPGAAADDGASHPTVPPNSFPSSVTSNGGVGTASGSPVAATDTATASGSGGTSRRLRRPRVNVRAPGVRAFKQLLQRTQQAMLRDSRVDAGKMVYSYMHASNGFAAILTAAQVQRMRRHPSVASVTPSRTITRRATSITDRQKSLNLPHALSSAASAAATPAAATPAATTAASAAATPAAATPAGSPSDGGEGTVIGIVDSGVWPEHPSFDDTGYSSSLPAGWAGTCPTTSDFACNNKIIGGGIFYTGFESEHHESVNLTLNWLSPRDSSGHGTWCAGAAAGNSGVNVPGGGTISGVAPKARLAIYKVYWRHGLAPDLYMVATYADVFAAVDQAVADGVDVLAVHLIDVAQSYGHKRNYFEDVPFIGALAAGVTVVVAAGDEGPSKYYEYWTGRLEAIDNFSPYYITVGARLPATTTPSAFTHPRVPYWSSSGPVMVAQCTICKPWKNYPSNAIVKPDIIGPGVNILAAAPGATVGETGSFVTGNSTAVAAANVAGVAALIIQQHPDWTPSQVMSAMMTTARRTDNRKKLIRNLHLKPASPWQMGAGHVFPASALDPGLTYDAGEQDFRNFLAGVRMERARKAFGDVPLTPVPARNLNRPAISLVNIVNN